MKTRPYVLTIAGFDPSSGAGLTADVKTFEALKVYGLSVCTANTVQNDETFKDCHWVDMSIIKAQIDVLFDRFRIAYVKIGIVKNWEMLQEIIDFVLIKNQDIKIVLDPVLQASSGFNFNTKTENEDKFEQVLEKIFLITPNYNEIDQLFADKSIVETIDYIQSKTNLLLKGGHRKTQIGKDQLFVKSGENFTMNPKMKNISEKHGSGCVLSSAITAYLKPNYERNTFTIYFSGQNPRRTS